MEMEGRSESPAPVPFHVGGYASCVLRGQKPWAPPREESLPSFQGMLGAVPLRQNLPELWLIEKDFMGPASFQGQKR